MHHESVVETVFLNGVKREALPAACFMAEAWEDGGIIAFRVVKEYREPREFWLLGNHVHESRASAQMTKDHAKSIREAEIVHVREVLD